jgi:tetratricopeptide (TPR) repeat protein
LEQAKELLARQDPKAAYALLEPLESTRAGNPDYDFLLGISAIDAGHATRGVFALERVLAVQPDNAQARAEIARAYYVLGETRASKQEFEAVQKMDIPPEASATIRKYLSAIDELTASEAPRLIGYLELGGGYDTNVNSATGTSSVAVPGFGGGIIRLDPLSVEQGTWFGAIGGGLNGRYPLGPGLALVGGLTGFAKFNDTAQDFDTAEIAGNVGLNLTQGRTSYLAALQGSVFDLDHATYRRAYGVTGQWLRTIDDFNSVSAFAQLTRLNYPSQGIRDADRWVVGGAYGHAFSAPYTPTLYFSGYYGQENERAPDVPFIGYDLWGARIGGQLTINDRAYVYASASYERRDYGGTDPFFEVVRQDMQVDLQLGASYLFAPKWVILPQITYTNNNSNVSISAYDRTLFFIGVRRLFE